jgi:hypothetical protein
MKLHPDIQTLVALMRRIEMLLQQHGEAFWSAQIAKAADRLAQSDASGLDLFLGMFGGAGSLNETADRLGGEVEAEIADAYRLAVALRREEDLTRS